MSEITPPGLDDLRQKIAAELSNHWKLILFQGILLAILGIGAILLPQIATLAVNIFIGWLLVIGGIFRAITLFQSPRLPGTGWSILATLLAIVVGVLLLAKPFEGILTLTMVMIAFFIIQGILSIMMSLHYRKIVRSWGWTLLSGIVDLILAYLIWQGWPDTATWAIGLLFGINMLFAGVALIMAALGLRTHAQL
ncbi:HdeD family acid-resistance protein [Sneathiella sp.]|uniref:HdeD family acid-resistance protein n=1 Tax=Sneathiella sp. TaxID=1964365 RepID=UPI002FE3E0F6